MISEALKDEMDRLESKLESLDLIHTLLGKGIEEGRATLSAIKTELGLSGQPELPMPPAAGTEKQKAE